MKDENKKITHVAVMCDDELLAALKDASERSGRKVGPEIVYRLRRMFKVGPFSRNAAKRRAGK